MRFNYIKMVAILISFALFVFVSMPASAVVMQSSSSALRNDMFVKGSSKKKTNKKTNIKKNRKEDKKKQVNIKAEKKNDSSLAVIPLRETQQEEVDNNPQKTIEKEIKDTPKESRSNYQSQIPYTKTYAAKLFKTLSGHITIEQKNIPKKIAVTQGSTLQLDLEEKPEAIWYVDIDESIAKISSNTVNGNTRSIVLETIGKGIFRLSLDNISVKNSDYKVLSTKKMRLIVD